MHYRALKERRVVRYETVSPLLGHWVDVSIYPDIRGGLSVYLLDISERKQTEAALRASEEQQAFLLALSDEPRPLTAPGDISDAAARRLAERLEVSRVAYRDIRDRKLRIEREYSRGVPPSSANTTCGRLVTTS